MAYDMRKEVNEAIAAGERALNSLRQAQNRLDSARTWGIFDMLGGGGVTGILKHMKVQDASDYLNEASRDLQIFQRELRDVSVPSDLQVEIDGFLTFADFFFDGFLADYLVQRKINAAREKVQDAISRTERILQNLRQYRY